MTSQPATDIDTERNELTSTPSDLRSTWQTMHLHNGIFTIKDMDSPKALLGSGSYGRVYAGTQQLLVSQRSVAVKVHEDPCLLNREVQIYRHLWRCIRKGHCPELKIPRLLWEGALDEMPHLRALVLERLGDDLEAMFQRNSQHSTAHIVWVATEGIRLLRDLHDMGIVHRDVKPANFAVGTAESGRQEELHLLDFGLSTQYIDANRKHQPEKQGLSLIGNRCYASMRNHEGIRQSRRDDLESLCYMLVHFAEGALPWGSAPAEKNHDRRQCEEWTHEQKRAYVKRVAEDTHLSKASALGRLLCRFYLYVTELQYDERPDYDTWIHHFQELRTGTTNTTIGK